MAPTWLRRPRPAHSHRRASQGDHLCPPELRRSPVAGLAMRAGHDDVGVRGHVSGVAPTFDHGAASRSQVIVKSVSLLTPADAVKFLKSMISLMQSSDERRLFDIGYTNHHCVVCSRRWKMKKNYF